MGAAASKRGLGAEHLCRTTKVARQIYHSREREGTQEAEALPPMEVLGGGIHEPEMRASSF